MYLLVDQQGCHNGQKIYGGQNAIVVAFRAVDEDQVHDFVLHHRRQAHDMWQVDVVNGIVFARDLQAVHTWYGCTNTSFQEVLEALRRQAPLEVERLLRCDSCTPRLTRLIIEAMPLLITHVPAARITDELLITAALRDLRTLPADPSEALQLAVVAKRWKYIGNLHKPTLAVQLAAYRQNAHAIQHIREPHADLLTLVAQDAKKKSIEERREQISHIELARKQAVVKITEMRRQVLQYTQKIAQFSREITELEAVP